MCSRWATPRPRKRGRAPAARFGPRNAEDLARLVIARRQPEDGALLLLSGQGQGFALATRLRAAGFKLIRRSVYQAVRPRAFPASAREALRHGRLNAVLFYSPETAQAFAELLPEVARADLGRVRALCLSPAVAARLAGLGFAKVDAAAMPDQVALLGLL